MRRATLAAVAIAIRPGSPVRCRRQMPCRSQRRANWGLPKALPVRWKRRPYLFVTLGPATGGRAIGDITAPIPIGAGVAITGGDGKAHLSR